MVRTKRIRCVRLPASAAAGRMLFVTVVPSVGQGAYPRSPHQLLQHSCCTWTRVTYCNQLACEWIWIQALKKVMFCGGHRAVRDQSAPRRCCSDELQGGVGGVYFSETPRSVNSEPKYPETTLETPLEKGEQWEPTEVKESPPEDTASFPAENAASPAAHGTEDFQEELVIRPLHSGDIYASFQFRTAWETDFMNGNKVFVTFPDYPQCTSCRHCPLRVEVADQQRVLRTGCLVTGVHTPPIRRNSKLATIGRLFKPWKWRKKKNEKLKQSSTDVALSSSLLCHDPSSPTQGCCSDGTLLVGSFGGSLGANLTVSSVEYLGPDENHLSPVSSPLQDGGCVEENMALSEEARGDEPHPTGELPDGLQDGSEPGEDSTEQDLATETSPPQVPPKLMSLHNSGEDPGPMSLPTHLPNSYLQPKEPPLRAPETMVTMPLPLRGPLCNQSGSPHLNMIHPPMPPSCIMEELQRAFASKNRQESVHEGCEQSVWSSDGRLSRSCSSVGGSDWPKKEADENKENVRLDQCFSITSGLPFDLESWNDSVISGTLPRRLRKELLAVKLRNRPSKQELEDKNIFPARSDQERQEIRQQIEMKLAK
uniref:Uncharacterized protein n=1 Tax=Knipowitschia caucasica TaxID=637954 RepID=A0AAV2LXW8_KNICA